MRKEELKTYRGQKVSQLPEEVREAVVRQFKLFDVDEIQEAVITFWQDFLGDCSVSDGTEDESYWWQSLINNPHYWELGDICIVKLNILDFSDVRYETSRENPSLVIVDYGVPALIIDADAPYFGDGYILLYSEEPGRAKLLANEYFISRKDALREVVGL